MIEYFIIINVIEFILMGLDKFLSIKKMYRIPEIVLLIIPFLGGSIGGILGMIIATPCIACIKVILLFVLEQTGWIKYLKGEKKKDNEIEVVEISKVKKKTVE